MQNSNSAEFSPSAKKSVFILFFFFLILFPQYAPYGNLQNHESSTVRTIFNLYFFISNQTFGIVHEGGHGVCYLISSCPKFFTALNGTIFQWLFPAGIAYYYKKQSNLMAMWIGIFFLGFTMHYTSWYISTAHEGAIIPAHRSFLGTEAYHDFNYILDSLGVLNYDYIIAGFVKFLSYSTMILAVFKMFVLGFWKSN